MHLETIVRKLLELLFDPQVNGKHIHQAHSFETILGFKGKFYSIKITEEKEIMVTGKPTSLIMSNESAV